MVSDLSAGVSKKGNIDFTKGSIIQNMILFSVPIVLGELFQNLYNSVDALVVGNFVGKYALGAVSVCDTIARLLVGFFTGMSAGVSVVVARIFGSGDREKLKRSMRVTFSFGAVLGTVLAALGILLTPALLRLTGAEEGVYLQGLIYLRIYLGGLVFTVAYNVGAGILRAIGDSRTPFHILVVTCITNIVLDLLLVAVFGLGIAGVSFATVCSQFLSVVLVFRKLRKTEDSFRICISEIPEEKKLIREVVNIGTPSGLQYSLISFSNLFVWRYINVFGAAATAGVGVAMRLDKFISLPTKAFGLTISTFVSQNVGARNYERSREGILRCLALSLAVTFALGAVVYVFTDRCVSLFSAEPDVVEIGSTMLKFMIPFYLVMVVREIFLGALRGYGYARTPMILSLFGMVVLRQLFLAIVMRHPRIEYIYAAFPLGWGLTAFMLMIYYFLIRGQIQKKMAAAEAE